MRCELGPAVGAYVLAALEPDEQFRMEQHVQECPACGDAVRELEALPRLLAAVPAPGAEAPMPSELAFQRFRRSAAAVPTAGRRRWPRRAVMAVAAVAVAAAAAAGIVVATSAPDPTVVQATAGGVHAAASYVLARSGTSVTIELRGVPMGERCELVAVSHQGWEESAGPWQVTYPGTYHWSGWVAMEPPALDHFVIRTPDGRTLITLPA